jgi:signal recognition particle receptor subunit beta
VVLFNYAIREITAKIVYYGPGLCGKTTNLQFIHEKLDPGARGKLLSLATDGDRTLFFDFLPIEMGSINGYKVRFQLYTVPGQVHYNATRKLVLKGVDAVVFVADSQLSMIERNRESFENLVENLAENGYELARVPVVIQLNKRDLPNVASPGELVAAMGVEGFPVLEAVAYKGEGVFDTLKAVVRLTLGRLRSQFEAEAAPPPERREAPPPPPPPPPPATVFAPSAPPAPPPAPGEAAAEEEHFDEFDLEEYGGEETAVAAPAAEEGADETAEPPPGGFGGGVDRAREFEMFAAGGDAEVGYGAHAAAGVSGEPAAGTGAAEEAGAGEPPAWARAMQEELQSLRGENARLRGALLALAGTIESQIAALEAGREELRRAAGGPSAGEEQG